MKNIDAPFVIISFAFIMVCVLFMVQSSHVAELKKEARVQKEIIKACEADRMWKEIQIRELGAEPL